jgi:hypothetical protein
MARKAKKKPTFTGKERAFIDAYFLCNFNGVRAARKAGYQGSYSTLGVVAHDNLKKPKIRAEIDKRLKAYQLGADEVLARYSAQATGSIEDFLDKDDKIDLTLARKRGKLHLAQKLVETTRTKTVGTAVVTERKLSS